MVYILLYSYMEDQGLMTSSESLESFINETLKNIVVVKNNLTYGKPVFPIKNSNYTTAMIKISSAKITEKYLKIDCIGHIGESEEFTFEMTILLLYNKDIHGSL